MTKNINYNKKIRPHVVILGAGASYAATINGGDKNNRTLPVMNNFFKLIGLEKLLDGLSLKTESNNFEDIYDEIYNRKEYKDVCRLIEEKVYKYFDNIEIGNDVTIYDLLILSLREKDAIFTFNWDPLLLQAYCRVQKIVGIKKLPKIFFLHGNTKIGICKSCKVCGLKENRCSKCGSYFEKVKLLFPIKNKNYDKDDFISSQWKELDFYLKNAFAITIFGYGAPKSDAKAIELMKRAWGNLEKRELEQIEIIDIKSENDILESWKEFIFSHHYDICSEFSKSWLYNFPRRSIEAMCGQFFECEFLEAASFNENINWEELKEHIEILLKEEN